VDMGVEPFLVSSTVEAVMAQRLVRRLCSLCRQPYKPVLDDLPPDFPRELLGNGPLYRPAGCRECRHLGYSGRMGIYELMVTTEDVRRLAHDNASTWEIKKAAVRSGMVTLRSDGWRKVIAGQTSVDEVMRVTKGDREVVMIPSPDGLQLKDDAGLIV
jgi:type II secretory ATPase GspE/PulE/Tfp pilus assembly ATPase PilB-like protein